MPFCPDGVWKDAVFAAAIILPVMACAFFFGPFGPSGQPDPTIIQTAPKPDFFFLWIYAVLAFLPPALETPVLLIVPVIAIAGNAVAAAVCSVRARGTGLGGRLRCCRSVIAVSLGIFTRLGTYTPWSPVMDAWSSRRGAASIMQNRTPLERQGAIVLQDKQCRNCHPSAGWGNARTGA